MILETTAGGIQPQTTLVSMAFNPEAFATRVLCYRMLYLYLDNQLPVWARSCASPRVRDTTVAAQLRWEPAKMLLRAS